MGACLDGAATQSLKNWTIFEGQFLAKSWIGLRDSIMTGRTAAHLRGLENSFDLMARDPEMVGIFNAAMMEGELVAIPISCGPTTSLRSLISWMLVAAPASSSAP